MALSLPLVPEEPEVPEEVPECTLARVKRRETTVKSVSGRALINL
jgi:hypothetical protein